MTFNPSNQDAALKVLFLKGKFHESSYKNNPMYATTPKFEGFGGRNMPMVNEYALPQGVSATFADAQANSGSSGVEDFLIDTVNLYSVVKVDGELLDRARQDDMSFVKYATAAAQKAIKTLANKIETYIPRDGSGAIARFSSSFTAGNKTNSLASAADSANLEYGMVVRTSATKTGALKASQETIAGVNRASGSITATNAAWNTAITSIAASDYIFLDGTAQNGGTDAAAISGYEAWLPSVAPTVGGGDSFFGVDRAVDSRLYGQYLDASAMSLEDGAIEAQSMASQEEGDPRVLWIHQIQFRKFVKQLGAKVQTNTVNAKGAMGLTSNVGFSGVAIEGSPSPVTVMAANKVPHDKGFMTNPEHWELVSMGPATKFIAGQGREVLYKDSEDAIEVRTVGRLQLTCKHPIGQVHMLLPT